MQESWPRRGNACAEEEGYTEYINVNKTILLISV